MSWCTTFAGDNVGDEEARCRLGHLDVLPRDDEGVVVVGVGGQGKFYDHWTGSTQDILLQHFSYHKYFIHLKSEFRQVIETLKRYAFKEIIKLVKRSKIRNLASMVKYWFAQKCSGCCFL